MSQGLPMLIILPLAGGLASLALPWCRRLRAVLVVAILGTMSAFLIPILGNALTGEIQVHTAGSWPLGMGIGLAADLMGSLMLAIVLGLSWVCMAFSFGELGEDRGIGRLHCAFLFLLSGLNGMVLATDLFNLFVFVEVVSVSAYVLVAYSGGEEALEGALKYMVIGTLSSLIFLIGIAMLYDQVGSLNLGSIGEYVSSGGSGGALDFSVLMVLIGMGMPAAIFPMHVWLVDAYSGAPSTYNAISSGASVQVATFAMVRVFHQSVGQGSVGILDVLPWAGLATALLGALMALSQNDLKRLLAYTTISSGGFSVLLLSLGSTVGFKSLFLHMINHAAAKALLFLSAGCLMRALSVRDLDGMRGAWSLLPATCIAFIIGAVADFGGPSLGFLSKGFMFLALLDSGPIFVGVAAVSVILVAVSYLKVFQVLLEAGPDTPGATRPVRSPSSMSIPVAALVLACVLLGLASWMLLGLADRGASQIMDAAAMISAFLGI